MNLCAGVCVVVIYSDQCPRPVVALRGHGAAHAAANPQRRQPTGDETGRAGGRAGQTGTSFVGVTTFKHVVKGDKFLESFEDPAAAAAASPSASRASSSGGGKGKGKDLLKSVETDKFLAGFLGGV